MIICNKKKEIKTKITLIHKINKILTKLIRIRVKLLNLMNMEIELLKI